MPARPAEVRRGGRGAAGPSAQDLLGHARLILRLARRRIERRLAPPRGGGRRSGALLLDDPLQSLLDLAQDAFEVRGLQLGLPPLAELVEDAPQARDVATARTLHPALHEPLQGAPHVALGQDVLAQRARGRHRRRRVAAAGSVPARVAVEAHASDPVWAWALARVSHAAAAPFLVQTPVQVESLEHELDAAGQRCRRLPTSSRPTARRSSGSPARASRASRWARTRRPRRPRRSRIDRSAAPARRRRSGD